MVPKLHTNGTRHHSDPAAQARLRAYAFDGVSKFHMSHTLGLVPLLLHISVFLFLLGMVEFLFPINNTVTFVVLGFVIAMVCTYLLFTVFPLACLNFPYSTPLSPLVWRLTDFPARVLSSIHWLTLTICRLWTAYKWNLSRWQDAREDTLFNVPSFYHQFRVDLRKRFTTQAVHADASVLGKQLIRELDTAEDVDEIEAFLEGMHATLMIDEAFSAIACFQNPPSTSRTGGRTLRRRERNVLDPAMAPLLSHEENTVAVAARCIQAIVASNAVTKALPGDMADLDTLASLVNPPLHLQHAVCDTDSLRANGGLLVLINLLADLAAPLSVGDALSAQIACIVGEVVPWLFPPWELRAHVVPDVREALADACASVYSLADEQTQVAKPPGARPRTPQARAVAAAAAARQQRASPERPGAFAKLVEELRALAAFVFDEPQHAPRG
ncbi:hypothetical protein BJV78DRAFT_1287812 [Lactifluus subvellereus]|nr:hypothetical protein BJV78DRAFT_1287812 [Lactifluus subvellereus]